MRKRTVSSGLRRRKNATDDKCCALLLVGTGEAGHVIEDLDTGVGVNGVESANGGLKEGKEVVLVREEVDDDIF